jgi:hypothetical protein
MGISGIFWLSVTIVWIINYRCVNHQFTKPIHFIFTFALIFKTISACFQYLFSSTCGDSSAQHYYDLGYSSTSTIYYTFLFTILLLMSKGLGLTRDVLERDEISGIALIMGVIYLGFSAFTIDKDRLKPILMLMLCVLWYSIYQNTSTVVLTLLHRQHMLRSYNLARPIEPLRVKTRMMRFFGAFSSFLFLTQLSCITADFVLFLTVGMTSENYEFYVTVLSGILEGTHAVSVGGIGVVFMPRFRGNFFDVADTDNVENLREITPMYECKMNKENGRVEAERPFLILMPGERGGNDFSEKMIAIPLKLTYRRRSLDDLREPLLMSSLS